MPRADNRGGSLAAMRKMRSAESEIGEIPQPKDWARRNSCRDDLAKFLQTYRVGFDDGFTGELFPDQLEQVEAIQAAIQGRGCYAFSDFRGAGKTAIITGTRFWLAAYGHADWIVTICASKDATVNAKESFVAELMDNPLVVEDFPELAYPTINCDGNGRRLGSQTCGGTRTGYKIEAERIVLPDVSESCGWQEYAKGAIMELSSPASIGLRGKNRRGKRPDVLFLDDIESDGSAASSAKTASIEQVLISIAGMGSHYRDVCCIWIGTIIATGCLMDRYSDPMQHASWNGRRYVYMKTAPTEQKLWERYVEVRRDARLGGPDAARNLYLENREVMSAGAVLSWPDGYDRVKYVDALEKYYALQADKGLKYVACELQNNPAMLSTAEDRKQLTVDGLLKRANGLVRGVIPDEAVGLTAMIDVQDVSANPMYWEIDWFNSSFGGGLYAYGTWPLDGTCPQEYYERVQDRTIDREELLSLALSDVTAYLKEPEYHRANGTRCPIVIAADTGDGPHQRVVFALARQEGVVPTKGVGLKTQVLGSGKNTKAIARGVDWYSGYQTSADGVVAVVLNFESRRWKNFARDRLQAPRTSPTAWQFYGSDATAFLDLAQHYASERSREVGTPDGSYTEWTEHGPNHWWDCHVGCHALASYQYGLVLAIDGGLVAPAGPPVRRQPFRLNVAPV